MNTTLALTVVLLVAMTALETESGPIFLRCQCNKVLPDDMVKNKTMNPLSVRGINRYPAGAHCKNEEVIIEFLRRKLCVNPKAEWVISLEKIIQQRAFANVKTNNTLVITANATVITNTTVIAGNNATMITGNNTITQELQLTLDTSKD
ncbi:hypothetical protein ACEWY4_024952 [Coilia grayii]|uniref:Chemokine interleukin-8-like domain-containing protein n=1 Tax=Coilia grayii TaxID=363190 RepID=A0ABD1IW58_9TELE